MNEANYNALHSKEWLTPYQQEWLKEHPDKMLYIGAMGYFWDRKAEKVYTVAKVKEGQVYTPNMQIELERYPVPREFAVEAADIHE